MIHASLHWLVTCNECGDTVKNCRTPVFVLEQDRTYPNVFSVPSANDFIDYRGPQWCAACQKKEEPLKFLSDVEVNIAMMAEGEKRNANTTVVIDGSQPPKQYHGVPIPDGAAVPGKSAKVNPDDFHHPVANAYQSVAGICNGTHGIGRLNDSPVTIGTPGSTSGFMPPIPNTHPGTDLTTVVGLLSSILDVLREIAASVSRK